jgi:hypothetical protein
MGASWTSALVPKSEPGNEGPKGVISHATNIVEHPELIARRLVN